MTAPDDATPLIEAASACWEQLAGFAWRSYRLSGPGAVLALVEDLMRVGSGDPGAEVPLNYFARDDIPAGDDFRSLMDTYDPSCQVMLMVGSDQGEQVLILEARQGLRRRPDSFDDAGPESAQ